MAKLIKMKNEAGKTAYVHPDMVKEYEAGGYFAEKPKVKGQVNDLNR